MQMKQNLLILFAAVFGVLFCTETFAQESFGRHGFGNHNGSRHQGAFRNPRAEAEKKLKEQYPAEWAEIQKLRDEAEKKLQELAKKAGVELPEPPKSMEERMADLKKKYPAEYAEYENLLKIDRRAAFGKFREMMMKEHNSSNSGTSAPAAPPVPKRENAGRQIAELQRKYPAEWAEIQTIRKRDPEKAKQMIRDLLKKAETESGK